MYAHALLDTLPCAALVIGSDGAIVDANPLAHTSLGAGVGALRGTPARRFLPSALSDALDDEFRLADDARTRRASEDGQPHRLARVDGRSFPARVTWRRLVGDDAGSALVTFIDLESVDVAEATESARRQRRLLHAILRNSPACIFVKDRDGRYTFVNANTERMIRQEARNILGRTAHDFVPRDIADVLRTHDLEVAAHGRRSREETIPIADDVRTYMSHKFPVYDDNGHVEATCSISLDITDINAARASLIASEAQLAESEARFRQLTEAIDECFFLTELPSQKVLYVSPAYETMWGRSSANLLADQSDWKEGIHHEDLDRVSAAFEAHLLTGDFDEEFRIVRPDGDVRWVRDRIYIVRDDRGTAVRLAGVVEDVTERRALEEQVRHTQKMESIGELAGGVAHDFNNWLTVILGCARLLEDECAESDARTLLDDIRYAGERAASLTRQLLAFSRKEVIEPRVLDLNAVVLDTEKMLVRLLGEDVSVGTTLAPSLPNIRFDPGHLVQVLMNVAVNARDAMPTGGTLEITTRAVVLDTAYVRQHPSVAVGRYLCLTMTDSGSGMSAEVRSRIFEPFFTTKGVGRGTGLGLAVVHGIVAQAGGHIDVASTLGEGTSFQIYIPAIAPDATIPTDTSSSDSLLGTETVLLVEDDGSVRRVARRVLTSAGYQVHDAGDGRQALVLLESLGGKIDLLVTDVVMPQMSGRALADQVRIAVPRVKVLFTSGYTDDAVLRHGVVHAEVAFLHKPYDLDALLLAARRLLDTK